jgi:hypothetical protein
MEQIFTNATVSWNEFEITRREALIREIPALLIDTWRQLNPAVKMERCESPMLVPASKLQSHIETGFDLLKVQSERDLYLRPETTVGTYEVFNARFPDLGQMKKYLPFCMWQVGCSFRDEKKADTMRASQLRLIQFYQMEFQLFTSHGTKAPYLQAALERLTKVYGGTTVTATELPHYSDLTMDWMMNDLEVAGCSVRKDWPHGVVFEVAIGLDRLVAMQTKKD